MKIVFNENNVSNEEDDSLPVKTINGKHYYLTEDDLNLIHLKENEWETQRQQRELDEIYNLRRIAYGNYNTQLDMQYHDLIENTTTWKDHIEAVKIQYPLP